MCVLVAQSCPTHCDPMNYSLLSMDFSRQDCWSGLSYPSPKDLPHPGIKPRSPALQTDSLPSEPPGSPTNDPGVPIKSIPWIRKSDLLIKFRSFQGQQLDLALLLHPSVPGTAALCLLHPDVYHSGIKHSVNGVRDSINNIKSPKGVIPHREALLHKEIYKNICLSACK